MVQQNSISSYPKMLVGSSFGACSLGESSGLCEWTTKVSLCQYCLCAICSRAVLVQICVTQLLPCYSWAKELRVLGRTGEKQRKILGLSSLGNKTWISEPGMLVLPLGDVGWSSPLSLWYLSWIQAGFSGSHWYRLVEDVPSGKERCRLQTAHGHSLLCQELCSNSLASFPELPAAGEHKLWQQLSHLNARGGNGIKTLETSPVNFSGKLPFGPDWVKLGSDLTCVSH